MRIRNKKLKASQIKYQPPDDNMGDMTDVVNNENLNMQEWNARPLNFFNSQTGNLENTQSETGDIVSTANSILQTGKFPTIKVDYQSISEKLEQNIELLEKFNKKLQIKKEKIGLIKISVNDSNSVNKTNSFQELL